MQEHNTRLLYLISSGLVILLTAVLYARVYAFEYVWDDLPLFVFNHSLRSYPEWVSAIFTPILPDTTYFRPLVLLSFVLEFAVADADSSISHLVNLAIHLVNTALVIFLAQKILKSQYSESRQAWIWPILAGGIYAFHVSLVESVAWVSGRFDLMVTMFLLLGFCASYVSKFEYRILLVTFAFLCAALSKEMAATFPVLLVLLWWLNNYSQKNILDFYRDWVQTKEKWIILSLMGCGLAYLLAKYLALDGVLIHSDYATVAKLGSVGRHLALIGHTLLFYLSLLVWPFPNSGPMQPFEVQSMTQIHMLQGWGALLAVLMFIVNTLLKPNQHKLIALMLLLSLLPVLNIKVLTIGGNIGHERFLTFPLFFFALLVVSIVSAIGNINYSSLLAKKVYAGLSLGVLMVWVLVSALNVNITLPLWRNDYSLWKWMYLRYPDELKIQYSALSAAIRARDFNFSKEIITRSKKDNDGELPSILLPLSAQLSIRQYQFDEGISEMLFAIEELKKIEKKLSHTTRPTPSGTMANMYSFAYSALTEAYIGKRMFSQAEEAALRAKEFAPSYVPSQFLLSLALYGQGKSEQADIEYEKALKMSIPLAKKESQLLKAQFINQLCINQKMNVDEVCKGK